MKSMQRFVLIGKNEEKNSRKYDICCYRYQCAGVVTPAEMLEILNS